MTTSQPSGSPDTPDTTSALQERGVIIEGQRIATMMNDAPRALLARAPLVLLPGAPFTMRDQRAILQRLAPERRVFALDWPGFGGSAHPAPAEFSYAPGHLADTLGRWLDSLGVARAVLLASGAAAGVAIRYAVAHPQRTLGLALVGPLGVAPATALDAAAGYALRVPALLRLAEPALIALALGPTTEATRALEEARKASHAQPERAAEHAALVALWREMAAAQPETYALARAVQAPCAVIRGGLDPLSSATAARLTAEALGEHGGLEITLPEAGHLPELQQPERYYQALSGLLNTAEANQAAAN